MQQLNLDIFNPISLNEMDSVSLMKRTDTKFIATIAQLNKVLNQVKNDYSILEIDGQRKIEYASNYFDTKDLDFYHDHHNGKSDRLKIRTRKYVASNLSFLEIKQKDPQGRTVKSRKRIGEYDQLSTDELKSYVNEVTGLQLDLNQTITNEFYRFTLVNTELKERITVDVSLGFNSLSFDDKLVIIELKQEKLRRSSPFFKALKAEKIYPMGISKYCIGMAVHNPKLKQNIFKPKLGKIAKLTTK